MGGVGFPGRPLDAIREVLGGRREGLAGGLGGKAQPADRQVLLRGARSGGGFV